MRVKTLFAVGPLALAGVSATSCGLRKFENLVTFGDSYTDELRLGYFIAHSGQAPPPGTLLPSSNATASGGLSWGRFVADATRAQYYNYAVSGATCSNEIVERYLDAIKAPFPSVADYEVVAYKNDIKFESLYPNRKPDNTVYALWIGTNDLGWTGFLSDSQVSGKTISDYVGCVWTVFDSVFETGGRHFVLLNLAPLQHAPLYASLSNGGMGDSKYWQNKTEYNTTQYEQKMLEYTSNVNTMFDYGAPFFLLAKDRWPGASFTVFDVNTLMADMVKKPDDYLSSPANATSYYQHCAVNNRSDCTYSDKPLSSFLWYDELHPSERIQEVIAKEFVEVLEGKSKYATTYRS